jgi:hypothetical protein
MSVRVAPPAAAILLGLLLEAAPAHAEPPPGWRLGGHVNVSAAGVPDGWDLGVAAGAKHRLASFLDLQLRLLGTYSGPDWHDQPYLNPGHPYDAGENCVHVLAEGTLRLRPVGPLFVGLGGQAGIRWFDYLEGARGGFAPPRKSEVLPDVRGLFELGTDLGPNESIEVGVRLALGSALGNGPVEQTAGTFDAELALTVGFLWPL